MALRHTAVVDHEEVDLEVVGAGPPDVVVLGADEVDHLDAAAVALPGAGHGALGSNKTLPVLLLVALNAVSCLRVF